MKECERVARYWAEDAASAAPAGANRYVVAEAIARIARMVFRIAFCKSLEIGHHAANQEAKRRGGKL